MKDRKIKLKNYAGEFEAGEQDQNDFIFLSDFFKNDFIKEDAP